MTSLIESINETAQVQLMIPSLKSPATKCFVGSRVVCRRPTRPRPVLRQRRGVEQNHALAATWVSKAAEQGDVTAQGFLGVLYPAGKGVEQDDALAVAWWEKAAVGDDVPSQFNLGLGYLKGRFGLAKNARQISTRLYGAWSGPAHPLARSLKARRRAALPAVRSGIYYSCSPVHRMPPNSINGGSRDACR